LDFAREDGHTIRARYAPLSPASGFPVSWSQSRQRVIREIFGLFILPEIPVLGQIGPIFDNYTYLANLSTWSDHATIICFTKADRSLRHLNGSMMFYFSRLYLLM
jgi:hypothetical protein